MITLRLNAGKDRASKFLETHGFSGAENDVWTLKRGIDSLRAVLVSRDFRSCQVTLRAGASGLAHWLLASVGLVISFFFFRVLTLSAPEVWQLVESRSVFVEWMDQISGWGVFLVTYFLVALGLSLYGGHSERLAMGDLKREFGGTIARPPARGSIFERATWPIYLMSFPLLFWFGEYLGSGFLLAMGALILLGDGIPNLLRALTKQDGAAQWRFLFMDSLEAWVTTVMLTLFMIWVLGTGATVLATLAGSKLGDSSDLAKRIEQWQTTNRAHFFPMLEDPEQAEPRRLAGAMQDWAYEELASKIRETNPFLPEEKVRDLVRPYQRLTLLKWTAMIGLLLLVLPACQIIQARSVLVQPGRWRRNFLDLVPLFSAPGVNFSSRLPRILSSAGIIVRIAYSGVLNWLSVVIAIDILAFVFSSRVAVLSQLQPILAIADLPSHLMDDSRLLICRILLLPLAIFPFWFIVARIQSKSIKRDKAMEKKLTSTFIELREKLPCRARLRILDTDTLEHYAHVPVVPLLPAVVVTSTASVEAYSDSELKAVIAHELAHIRNDSRRIKVLRMISLLLLLPNDAATMLMDFVQAEFRADRDTVSTMGDVAPICSALRKAAVYRSLVASRRMRTQDELLRYFFGKAMIGHGHPILTERLDRLLPSGRMAEA